MLQFKQDLAVLEIKVGATLTIRYVTEKFRRLAKIHHPDRPGGDKETFQKLHNAYLRLLATLNDNLPENIDDIHIKEFFKKTNFPLEKSSCFVVLLENELSKQWEQVLKELYGEGNPLVNGGIQFKMENMSVSFYEKPKKNKRTKLLIQGKEKDHIFEFVFSTLPNIYQRVVNLEKKLMFQEKKEIACDNCDYKSIDIPLLQSHIEIEHIIPLRKKTQQKVIEAYRCEECDFSDSSRSGVKAHITRIHRKQNKGSNVDKMEHSTTISPPIVGALTLEENVSQDCQKCEKSFEDDIALRIHKVRHEEDNEIVNQVVEDLLCNVCESVFKSSEEMNNHVLDKHKILNEVVDVELENIFSCEKCDFETEREDELKVHIKNNIHNIISDIKEVTENAPTASEISYKHTYEENLESKSCPFCDLKSKNNDQLKKHIRNIHNENKVDEKDDQDKIETEAIEDCFTCHKCEFIGNRNEMEKHFKSKHKECTCQLCGSDFVDDISLKDHLQAEHARPSRFEPFPCEKCGLVLATFHLLQEHMNSHKNSVAHKCRFCDFLAENEDSIQEHIIKDHEELVILHSMAKQVDVLTFKAVELDTFKSDINGMLKILLENQKSIMDNQTTIKQELFLIRNNTIDSRRPEVLFPHSTHQSKPKEPGPATSRYSPPPCQQSPSPPPPPRQQSPSPPQVAPPRSSHTSTPVRAQMSRPSQKDEPIKTLYIGDSISSNVNHEALEAATESKFITAKAYSSVHDNVENVAKKPAKFPTLNFTDVIPNELEKDNYKTLIIQAGSVDISNLNTRDDPERHIEYFRQEAVKSATNIFAASENALKTTSTLRKVVLMKQIPRYDPLQADPLGLKPVLSQLFNSTLTELWMKSMYKDFIHVGTHNIECTGAIREARYRHTRSGKFDGIHLLGSSGQKTFTASVLNILRAAKITTPEHDYHQSCPQFRYQNRRIQHNYRAYKEGKQTWKKQEHFQVPTYNRFSSLSQGNW